jgi:hypothetical protein
MSQNATSPAAGARTELGKCSLQGNTPDIAPKSPQAQRAFVALTREFIAECLRIASLKAAHGASNLEIGDDLCAERDIRIAVENLREAARSFRELERLTERDPQ